MSRSRLIVWSCEQQVLQRPAAPLAVVAAAADRWSVLVGSSLFAVRTMIDRVDVVFPLGA